MKSEIKELWIAALESGEYEQGRGSLRSLDDEFCCLGVLCDLAVKAGVAEWEEDEGCWWVDGGAAFLPESVMDWSGVDAKGGLLPSGGSLTYLNDRDMLSFPEIAQVIREEF